MSYFGQTQEQDKAEKTLSQGLHTNCFLSALLNVLDPEMAANLAPKLDSQTIPYKFDVVAAGIRQRLKIADVMVNQLEISSYPNSNQRVLFAASSHLDGAGSSNAYQNDDQNQIAKICVALEGLSNKVERLAPEHDTAGNFYSDYDSNYGTEDDEPGGY